MNNREYAEFVDRAHHDVMMSQGVGAAIAIVVLIIVAVAAFAF